jgi:isoleucyl-tRNA synthetase
MDEDSGLMFDEVKAKVSFPELEAEVIAFWREQDIFRKSLAKEATEGDYIFYEGPPTANGRPGVHHVISRAFKDLFPRYKTMRGYRVGRKGGWDTHGLPVEIEVEKRLGFKGKGDIEAYGIAEFNKLAKASAFEYIQEWNQMTERIGFWLDTEKPYITYENPYIESCWWVMKSLYDRDLLFEDYKVTMHCPRCNTSLADHEVSQGFRDDITDPSVWPKFPAHRDKLVEMGLIEAGETRPVFVMAWTTTPWTLPANTALAVKDDADYGLFAAPPAHGKEGEDLYILATALAGSIFGEGAFRTLKTFRGKDLVGLTYDPLLTGRAPADEDLSTGFRVVADDVVSLGDGTGVVHIAPAYGDLEVGRAHGLPTLFSVDLTGKVYGEVRAPGDEGEGPYGGQFFKDADKAIARDLTARGLLYRETTLKHAYPFCWRCGTPLLYYAKSAWYIRTTAVKDRLLANNQAVHWYPEHIKNGRFGRWLENNVDWSLSRERYWGAPLPIWVSEDGQERVCVGSVAELEALTGKDLNGLELHRPYVDDVTFSREGKTFRRLPYTVDVWFESGAMPYAQWHYPFENEEALARNFPADFICEAIDQTRGWFYSLHALATLLTDSGGPKSQRSDDAGARRPGALAHLQKDTSAYKNVIVLGHIVDENGEKMSKSKGNVVDPWTVLNAQGADALRWYLYASSPPGSSKRFSQNLVEETLRDFFLTLWNTYAFFVLYANLDKPDLTKDIPVSARPEIDRWLVAKVHRLTQTVTVSLEAYDPTSASRSIRDFVVEDLSNWYVRRNRRRFWRSQQVSSGHHPKEMTPPEDSDKLSAYKTLYEALITVAKLMAPMAPFTAEAVYQNLVRKLEHSEPESVHLAAWPGADAGLVDEGLLRDMNALIRVVELGRGARAAAALKTRQPLPEVLVRVPSPEELDGLKRLEDQLLEELNVKGVSYLDVTADFVDYTVKPNLPRLGKRLGKLVPELKKALAGSDGKTIAANIRNGVTTEITLAGEVHSFEPEAFLIDAKSPEGYAALEERGYLAALDTRLTPELVQEGLVRDVIRLVQNARKSAGLNVSDTIKLRLETSGELLDALKAHLDALKNEVLAEDVGFDGLKDPRYKEQAEVEGTALTISLKKAEEVAVGPV